MGYDELRDQAKQSKKRLEDGFPESWQPQDPDLDHTDILVGELKEVNFDAPTSYGGASVFILEDEDGKEWSVWLLHKVLKNQVFKTNPRVGDLVAFAYGGTKQGVDDEYHVYTVNVERQEKAEGEKHFQTLVKEKQEAQDGPEVEWEDGEGEFDPDDELPF